MAQIEGTVVAISEEGNLVTDISADQLVDVPRDDRASVSCGGHETSGIFTKDHGEPEATLLALVTDSGKLELGIVGLNMSEMLCLKPGEKVVVRWE